MARPIYFLGLHASHCAALGLAKLFPMFPFTSRNNKMSESPEAPATPLEAASVHPLDAVTGGAFSAPTSGERASRIRDWLATDPAPELLQEVFKELGARDKGATRAVRERLDELRRAKAQESIGIEWAAKVRALLEAGKLNIADAMAWQRDAAKAGAPLSREPLAQLKVQLADRVKVIEDLQHRVQVQREAAVLLAQRIDVLSTKPWRDAQGASASLAEDVSHWKAQAEQLATDANWPSVEARFPSLLDASSSQLLVVWNAFSAAVAQAAQAASDSSAPLPLVSTWADELRSARGESTQVHGKSDVLASKPRVSPAMSAEAGARVTEHLTRLEAETAGGHGKGSAGAATALRAVLKQDGKHISPELEVRVHGALVAAGELQGWQRWSADQVREDLVAQAQALLQKPEGQALGGRKMQEILRRLRDQWKQADQGGAPNHGLWKKFDEACTEAHKVVEAWLEKIRTDAAEHKAQRLQLIAELAAWGEENAANTDWKAVLRALRGFGERWQTGGHVGEKLFAELLPQWTQAIDSAAAPFEAAQKASLAQRHAMIDEATALGAIEPLRIDAVKALQQRWQAEAQAVPMERRREQKLWDAFRKPVDDAFGRKTLDRERAASQTSTHDKTVLEAAKALDGANASGDAQAIRGAMSILEASLRGQAAHAAATHSKPQAADASASAPLAASASTDTADGAGGALVEASAAPASDGLHSENPDASFVPGEQAVSAETAEKAVPTPVQKPRRVVAVRGDDRPGMKKDVPAAPGRGGRPGERSAGRMGAERDGGRDGGKPGARFGERGSFEERGPRLGDTAFRAQRDALEHAQAALRKLAAQAHGEALTQLLSAWEKRDPSQVPSAQEFGRAVPGVVRNAWTQAISDAPGIDAKSAPADVLLRLEIAAEVPTPAEQISARRMMQLQLLTRRNDAAPAQTWTEDVAKLLRSSSEPQAARRLQNVLKTLLRT